MELLKIKYLNICRICETFSSAFETNLLTNPTIKQMLLECINIQFNPQDDLPKNLCQQCCNKLESFYKFKMECKSADSRLQEALMKCKEKEDQEVSHVKLELGIDYGQETSATEEINLVLVKGEPEETIEHHFDIESMDESTHMDDCNDEKAVDQKTTKSRRGDKQFDCPYCDEQIFNYREFINHRRLHQKLNCSFCTKTFARKTSLETHLLEFHKDIQKKTSNCDQCHRKFAYPHNLRKHVQAVHLNDKQFACNECGLKYSIKSNLTIHKKSHIVDRQFDCPACGKFFKNSQELFRHKKEAKHYAPQKKYVKEIRRKKCDVCGTVVNNLKLHMRTHTGEKQFICDVCGRQFLQMNHFTGHQLIHAGIKPHKCEICDKSFTLRSSLKIHMQHHTEKRHKCSECPKAYTKARNLRIHQETHLKS